MKLAVGAEGHQRVKQEKENPKHVENKQNKYFSLRFKPEPGGQQIEDQLRA